MRVNNAVSYRFYVRAPLVAALVCASLTLSGCAAWRSMTGPAAPLDAATASGTDGAAAANAGAQTTQASRLQKFLWVFSPYRPDIQQGNFVSQEMLGQLKVGQTREQVMFILGTPLLTDIFHADRWDYPFYLARGDGELTSSRVSVYFKDNKVEKFDGGNLPTEREYIERIAGKAKAKPEAEAKKKEPAGSASIQINK
ncbi:outer membrane protein assembly factor BamE [Massilia sp. RP-1-19]|uniref:Outer membrane protein assembly factor BamE n=1 Tax=Massilia polaris TaxID=2728846 RepID=A0A848HK04_9BURK|nr:outer membrane protein assembly factor BamE [Massilia polaris]NML61452.1 outer membrane protein assembly factor BamE [Massilia polaris]